MTPPSGGYFLVYRSLLEIDHHLREGPACPRFAWIDLIGLATHEPYEKSVKMNLVRLERGEFLASVRYLAKRWDWSKNKVARFLHALDVRGQLRTVKGTPVGTVYRIVNYDTYQKPWDADGTASGTETGQQRDKDNTQNTQQRSKDADAQGRIFSDLDVGTEDNGQMKANELLGVWIDRQAVPPDSKEKSRQAGKAKHICKAHSREDIAAAFNGMNQVYPYSKGESWDLFDLERKFSKAKQAILNHPEIRAARRREEIERELDGI
jgi:hypothetical protein